MKKMKFILVMLLFGLTFNISAQTTIDIIRASNLYSKAMSSFRSGNYNNTLNLLLKSEENLKGKTNRDLLYLKIMTYYRQENYEKSYALINDYFNETYKEKGLQNYRNIKPYREKYNVNYSEKLTSIFVKLEEKFSLVTTTNVDDVINTFIVKVKNKIKNNLSRERFARKIAPRNFNYSWRENRGDMQNPTIYFNLSYPNYRKKELFLNSSNKTTFTYKAEQKGAFRFFSDLKWFRVNVDVSQQTSLSLNKYTIRYFVKAIKPLGGYIRYGKNGYTIDKTNKMITKLKGLIKPTSMKIDVYLSENEKTFFKRGDNLKKLKASLKKANLY